MGPKDFPKTIENLSGTRNTPLGYALLEILHPAQRTHHPTKVLSREAKASLWQPLFKGPQ